MPYATLERMTRPLIRLDRWVSRTRRTLRASDLASVLNAIISLQPTGDSAEADTILRALEYKSTWPLTAEQIPAFAFGERTWGQLLESLIEHAPPLLDYYLQGATNDVDVGNALPNVIETTFNPLSIALVWLRPDGAARRCDFYGPAANNPKPSHPYGTAGLLVRKSFLQPQMIQLAGEILRDSSVSGPGNARPETAASLPGGAAALRDQPATMGTGAVKHPHPTEPPSGPPAGHSHQHPRSTDDARHEEEDPPPRRASRG